MVSSFNLYPLVPQKCFIFTPGNRSLYDVLKLPLSMFINWCMHIELKITINLLHPKSAVICSSSLMGWKWSHWVSDPQLNAEQMWVKRKHYFDAEMWCMTKVGGLCLPVWLADGFHTARQPQALWNMSKVLSVFGCKDYTCCDQIVTRFFLSWLLLLKPKILR